MRIIVPIKQVPETSAVTMDEATGTMVREGVEAIVNPLDLYAIEVAIQLCDAHRDVHAETVAVTMGPPAAASALREAVAMGIDTGILVSDKAFAGSDTWSTSCVLAAAVRKLGQFDLVICGERATDGDTGQVGPGLAAFLGLPVATYVGRIADVSPQSCRVHRLVEHGYEIMDVQLPAVLTVVKEIAAPRLPTLRGKQKAKSTETPTLGSAALDIDPTSVGLKGSPTRVVKIFRPQVARECEKIHAGDEAAIDRATDRVVEFLQKRDLI